MSSPPGPDRKLFETREFESNGMLGQAAFSNDGRYRYDLSRMWAQGVAGKSVVFVMLNPSTADERILDPTITRCLGFAHRWGYGILQVRNCFALRSSSPAALKLSPDPVGPLNDSWLRDLITGIPDTELVVAAWGTHAGLYSRDRKVAKILADHPNVKALGYTKEGFPKHPLYVPASTELVDFDPDRRTS